MGHSLVRLLPHSNRSLIRLLARSAAPIRSLARSLSRSRADGKEVYAFESNALIFFMIFYPQFSPASALRLVSAAIAAELRVSVQPLKIKHDEEKHGENEANKTKRQKYGFT